MTHSWKPLGSGEGKRPDGVGYYGWVRCRVVGEKHWQEDVACNYRWNPACEYELRIDQPAAAPDVLREALAGYRAAIAFVSADSWDGCSDCIDVLKAARCADMTEAMTNDEIASNLARIRKHYTPALAATEPAPMENV